MNRSCIFRNGGPSAMVVWVEPWCDEIAVPAGSSLTIISHGEQLEHAPTIERTEAGLTFWPEGETYTAELDGAPYPV